MLLRDISIVALILVVIYLFSYQHISSYDSDASHIEAFKPVKKEMNMFSHFIIWKNYSVVYCNEDEILPEFLHTVLGNGSVLHHRDIMKDKKTTIKETMEKKFNKTEFRFLSLVQHPVQRFIKHFVHYCVKNNNYQETYYCSGCYDNLKCVVSKIFDLSNYYTSNSQTFIPTYFDHIFMPYIWKCDFKNSFSQYRKFKFFDKKQFKHEVNGLLFKANISGNDHIESLIDKLYEKENNLINQEFKMYRDKLLKNEKLMYKFIAVYFYDFFKYGIPLPNF
uniref:Glycosyltransferase family 92 protein n=1 Tax=Parastrongyloides trichosuri TaxID=131310 RepID=A0A0N4Z7K3_PARTI